MLILKHMSCPLAVNGTIHIAKGYAESDSSTPQGNQVLRLSQTANWISGGKDYANFLYTDFPLNVIDIAMEILRSIMFCNPSKGDEILSALLEHSRCLVHETASISFL